MKNNKNSILKNVDRQKLWIFHHLHHHHHSLILKIEFPWIKLVTEPILWMKSETISYNLNMSKQTKKEESILMSLLWILLKEMTLLLLLEKKSPKEKWYLRKIKAIHKMIDFYSWFQFITHLLRKLFQFNHARI